MSITLDDKVQDDKDNVLFKKLRKLINLIDRLRDCGVQTEPPKKGFGNLFGSNAGKK